MKKIDFSKNMGLVPVIIQDLNTLRVLMMGYMNEEALEKTMTEKKVTFFSRSRNCLWTKGETSGNYLIAKEIASDCDNDTLLIKVETTGPVCHTGNISCFSDKVTAKGFIYQLEQIINQRIDDNVENSYTNKLFNKGINKIAQKVGEEAVELLIESKDDNPEAFKGETADLLYHLLVLLRSKKILFSDIEEVLQKRNQTEK
jgi:phosphoribosyl-ATP pyrophosphohydrolase/phosphoribosyl-AMP cyclohydrolase